MKLKKLDQKLGGHSSSAISVDWKGSRPFKVFTASQDNHVNVFKGPPFKFDAKLKNHKNFVNCLRISPDNTTAVTVGSDFKITIFNTETNETIGEVDEAHKGSIYSIAWYPCNTKFATCSADKTVKIWSVEGPTLLQ